MAIVYKEEWKTKLQERLLDPTLWKELCNVEYTDTKVIHNPYRTASSSATGTRGTAYTYNAIAMGDESVDIDTFLVCPELIDRADLAQSGYLTQMNIAEDQGKTLNKDIETAMFAEHAQFTDFDNASIGGSAGNITVATTNVDSIIDGVKREIREADGTDLMDRNGAFIVWRPADYEKLEAYARAQGFSTADDVLKNGLGQGFKYGGVEHFYSNRMTAGHLFGGVKKLLHLGICKGTYGDAIFVDEPATSDGSVSGVGVTSRVDYKFKAWLKTKVLLFDILVA